MSSVVRVYPDDQGNVVVSENGSWVPGVYDSEATARRAVTFPNSKLAQLRAVWEIGGEHRAATMADLDSIQ